MKIVSIPFESKNQIELCLTVTAISHGTPNTDLQANLMCAKCAVP